MLSHENHPGHRVFHQKTPLPYLLFLLLHLPYLQSPLRNILSLLRNPLSLLRNLLFLLWNLLSPHQAHLFLYLNLPYWLPGYNPSIGLLLRKYPLPQHLSPPTQSPLLSLLLFYLLLPQHRLLHLPLPLHHLLHLQLPLRLLQLLLPLYRLPPSH